MKSLAFCFILKVGKLTKKSTMKGRFFKCLAFYGRYLVGGIIGAIAGAILGKRRQVALLEILSWAF